MKTTHRALVAGAGIAGLTAATALHDLGWAVDLVERRETLDAIPTGLFIPANGMRAFAALGAADALRSRGREIRRLNVRAVGGGAASVPLDVVWPQVGPSVAIERETAVRTLQELCPVTVQWGNAVQALTQHGKQVSVTLSDGSGREYDLVVGADGVNSTVRLATWPDAAARYAGDCWWRGVTACPAALEDWNLASAGTESFWRCLSARTSRTGRPASIRHYPSTIPSTIAPGGSGHDSVTPTGRTPSS